MSYRIRTPYRAVKRPKTADPEKKNEKIVQNNTRSKSKKREEISESRDESIVS